MFQIKHLPVDPSKTILLVVHTYDYSVNATLKPDQKYDPKEGSSTGSLQGKKKKNILTLKFFVFFLRFCSFFRWRCSGRGML